MTPSWSGRRRPRPTLCTRSPRSGHGHPVPPLVVARLAPFGFHDLSPLLPRVGSNPFAASERVVGAATLRAGPVGLVLVHPWRPSPLCSNAYSAAGRGG